MLYWWWCWREEAEGDVKVHVSFLGRGADRSLCAEQQVDEAALLRQAHFLRQSDPETCHPLNILSLTASPCQARPNL